VITRQDSEPVVGYQSTSPLHRVGDERLVAAEREELLGALARADWPESRSDAAGEDRDPDPGVRGLR
jgi:hypothetical protein